MPWLTLFAQGQNSIPVVGADGVFEAGGTLSPTLGSLIDMIPSWYFPVRAADGIHTLPIDPPTGTLPALLGLIPSWYFPVRASDGIHTLPIDPPTGTLPTLLDLIPSWYFPVRASDGVVELPVAYPAAMMMDTRPPKIYNVNVNQITGLVEWETDEWATSEVRHGTQPVSLTHVVSDTTFVKTHLQLLAVPSEAQHMLIRSADRSGNWAEYYVPGFSISGHVSDENGAGIEDASLSVSLTQVTLSDAQGDYTLSGIPGGTRVVTPYHPDYAFTPTSITLTLTADVTGIDFVGQSSTPSNLVATPVSSTQIDLSWQDNSSGESEFHVERSPDGANWSEIGTVPANVTTYNHTGLSCSTSYYYRVRAHWHADNHFTDYSNVASATTSPCAPSNLTATSISATQINITWQDNSPDESEFHIERSPNGVTAWISIWVPPNTTSYSNTNLSCSTRYYYRIRAHRQSDGHYSSYSSIDSAKTSPCAPSNPIATPISRTQINFTWQDNSPDESEFHIERYFTGGIGWKEIARVPANVTSYSDTHLNCETRYDYRVRAHRHSDGQFSAYAAANAVTQPCLKVYLPVILRGLPSQSTITIYRDPADEEATDLRCPDDWLSCRNVPVDSLR